MNTSRESKSNPAQAKQPGSQKILLGLLPYWTPLIPPLGISSLKTFLSQYGCRVKTVDLNIEEIFQDIIKKYYYHLGQFIPGEMKGNFQNIGNDVIREQMMAHINYTDKEKYIRLIRQIIEKNFFVSVSDREINPLIAVIDDFYQALGDYIPRLLAREKPTVFGLSVYNGNLPASLFAFRLVKETYPDMITIMGGGVFCNQLEEGSPNFEFFLKKTPYIDKIIVGEGEILLLKLLRGELPPSQKVYTLKEIDNETLDLESMKVLDFSDFNLGFYTNLAAYASRSCLYQCAFCSETTYWGKYRKRKTAKVVDELRQLSRQYGNQLFLFGDSLLNPFISDLANELLKIDQVIYWDGYLKASKAVCDAEKTLHWRQAGFYRARLGMESGAQRILDIMGKKVTLEILKQSLSSLANAGIKTTTYWVIGHPGETEADFQQTLDMLTRMKDFIYEAECNPFRFYLTGQVKSREWGKQNKTTLLYPEEANEMLMVQTWQMQGELSREDIYRRVRRFVQHCRTLGIPNPYSLNEISQADDRWAKLHKNSVPPLLSFRDMDHYIDECRNIKRFYTAGDAGQLEGDWNFQD